MSCTAYRDELVAFCDQALAGRAREAVAAHLMRCHSCRVELDELRSVRRAVACAATPCTASADLSARLRAIAGDQAGEQLSLGTDTPRSAGAFALPSPRRLRRRLALVGSSAMVAMAGGALGGAWLLAPDLRPVSDIGLTTSSVTLLSGTSDVCPIGFTCPEHLGELELVGLIVDSQNDPSMMRAEYACPENLCEGRVVVVQRRGMMACEPGLRQASGNLLDNRVAQVWQSSDLVIAVSGTRQAVELAEASLPHEEPAGGKVYRLKAGFRSLTGQRGR